MSTGAVVLITAGAFMAGVTVGVVIMALMQMAGREDHREG